MKVSVFTPHSASGIPYIRETWESLQAQTYLDWEWIVVENHGGTLPGDIREDARVVVVQSELEGVGALKGLACSLAKGEILFELDHDDLLHPDALSKVVHEVAQNGADFVYSDFAEFKDGSWEPNPYSPAFGWERYGVEFQGHPLIAMRAPTDPVAWRRIEWAPNHLRAWRTSAYRGIQGHRSDLTFADDHDLVLRTYLAGLKVVHIPLCLYFYRVHANQNVKTRNNEIQALEAEVYDRWIYQLAETVAKNKPLPEAGKVGRADGAHLKLIDLCGAHSSPPHYTPMDRVKCEDRPDLIVADLDERWPLDTSSVGVLRAFDAIEHLRDPVHTMNEAWRVLAPGGFMLIMVPSTDAIVERRDDGTSELINGSGAYCDPTHVTFWNRLSFRYYSDDRFRRYVPDVKARFQVARLRTINAGGIPYVQAELIALKEGYHPMGEVTC